MNKATLHTDVSSEVLKAVDPTVAQNAAIYRQAHGVLTLSVITVLEIVKGRQQSRPWTACGGSWMRRPESKSYP